MVVRLKSNMNSAFSIYKILIMWSCFVINVCYGDNEHRTKAASVRLVDHFCYHCDSMLDKKCENISTMINSSEIANYQSKCPTDQRICRVKRISMSSTTEDQTGVPKLWLLQRNCSKVCDEGCIVIGERTKLRSCTTCCHSDFCNDGNSASNLPDSPSLVLFLLLALNVNALIHCHLAVIKTSVS